MPRIGSNVTLPLDFGTWLTIRTYADSPPPKSIQVAENWVGEA